MCLFSLVSKQCYLAWLEDTRNRSGFHFRLLTVLIKETSQGASAEKNGSFTSWQPFYKRRFFDSFFMSLFTLNDKRKRTKTLFYFKKFTLHFFLVEMGKDSINLSDS